MRLEDNTSTELGARAHALLVIENMRWPDGFPWWAHNVNLTDLPCPLHTVHGDELRAACNA